ncbi:MAG: hypothetical protein LKM36_05935 [Flavobacteriales bacterium]|nr:hypothetical protein [Flavobacteriales bacterium]MCI1752412.1 hypothetical protein [Flavobacteriales bacterium]
MTRKQIRIELDKKLETIPEQIWDEVIDYLNDFEQKNSQEQKRIIALREILTEKRGLLLRLAQ